MSYQGVLRVITGMMLFLSPFTSPGLIYAQEAQDSDPFAGNYILGNSAEAALIWSDQPGGSVRDVSQKIYDVNVFANTVVEGTIEPQDTQLQTGLLGVGGRGGKDMITGDLNGDNKDDIVAAWEGPDNSLILLIPEIQAGTLNWSNATTLTLDGVLRDLEDNNSCATTRHRLVAGNFDMDPQHEFVLGYWAQDGTINLTVYDTDGTMMPIAKASIAEESQDENDLSCSHTRFDVAVGDFDNDNLDEIVLVGTEPADNFVGWNIFVRAYDYDPGTGGGVARILPTVGGDTIRGTTTWNDLNNDDYDVFRLAVAGGDFDQDTLDEFVLGFQIAESDKETINLIQTFEVEGNEDFTSFTLKLESGDDERFPSTRVQHSQTRGNSGWPFSIVTGDVNRDGREEALFLARGQVRVYECSECMECQAGDEACDDTLLLKNIGSQGVSALPGDDNHRTIALADTNAEQSLDENEGVWRSELIVVSNESFSLDEGISSDGRLRLKVFEIEAVEGAVRFTEQATLNDEVTDGSGPRQIALAAGDFDGNAIRLGRPTLSRITEIRQPLVILNAPPTHFDLLDDANCPGGQCDVNACYNDNECGAFAIHETETERTIEVSTEVTADWAVSSMVEGSVSLPFKFLTVNVEASVRGRYGERFTNSRRFSRTISVRDTQEANVDDFIYATVGDYDVWEYPVFVEGVPEGFVLAVIPRTVQNRWFDSKSFSANAYVPPHEVGNILSYQAVTQSSQNDAFAEDVRFQTGDGRTLSDRGRGTWSLTDESTGITEKEREVEWSVGATESVSFSDPFGIASVGVTVSGDYGETSISTHSTVVTDRRGLSAEFGTIDLGLGNVRYTVTPYVYWAKNGAFVLDYAVEPELSAPGDVATFWDVHYGTAGDARTDPAFILPFRYDPEKGLAIGEEAQRERTRDIVFNPVAPEAGDIVTITARVQNFSLLPTNGPVPVRFFVGDPENGGIPIVGTEGETEALTMDRAGFPIVLEPRGTATVQMQWELPTDILNVSTLRIYAVIDPDGQITEIHETNNTGWSILNPTGGRVVDPTGGQETLGINGDATGLSLDRIICTNKSVDPKHKVRIEQNVPNPWNCDEFRMASGDDVQAKVLGIVDDVDNVGGSVNGIAPTLVVCKNKSIEPPRPKVRIEDGLTSWSCSDAGLPMTAGDLIQMKVKGTAN